MKKRILSILLCLVMVVGLLPTTAFASGGEVHECSFCSNVYYGDDVSDYLCEDCNACIDCWSDMHCHECGACYADIDQWCEDCTHCLDCQLDQLDHCIECGNCYFDNEDELCGECHRCDSCAYICPYCGICEDCWDEKGDEMHCPICGECYEVAGPAECGGSHCAYCCEFCEQCSDWETCLTDDPDKEFCDECGLCMDCCMENRNAAGCEEYCIESAEFEYHFCEDCGDCFCDKEPCPYCGLCEECCANNSECTDSEPMCVEDGNYDDHFCENCGSCKCEGWDEVCEFCGLCPECCEDEIASERIPECTECDEFKCKEDPDFIEHMVDVHEETITHTHRFSVLWSMDEQYHWHDCVACADGKSAEGSMTVAHSFDSKGICKTCGYKNGETVYFTTQPRDVHTTVGNSEDYDRVTEEHGKNHPYEIRTSFRAKAYGKSLSYQWYKVWDDEDGTGTKLKDVADGSYNYVSGADTPTLTVCVDNEACFREIYFYCVATDENGNTARSRSARMAASHRYASADYRENLSDEGCKYIYVKSSTSGSTGYYQQKLPFSSGHLWYCCGEHSTDDPAPTLSRTPKPHNFGGDPARTVQAAYTAKAAAAGSFLTFNVYKCTDCGYEKYVEKHEHRMFAADPTTVDESLFTKTSHPTVCEVAGCDKTGSEPHNWTFRTVQWPSNGSNGGVVRECLDCGYWDEDFTQKIFDKVTSATTYRYWDRNNMLVEAKNGSVNRTMIVPGDSVILTPEKDGVHKFAGWTAKYEYQQEGEAGRNTVNVTLDFVEKADGTWTCTIPTDFFTMNGVLGGGKLTFIGTMDTAACIHSSVTEKVGYREARCLTDGYTGDTVCNDCGKIVEKGEEFASGSDGVHTGNLTLDESTVVAASCKKHGYSGDKKCDYCDGIVHGESTPFVHGNKVTTGYVAPTCTTDGYTGDMACNDCGKEFGTGKVIPALKHDWDDGVKSTGIITTITYTCKRCGETYTRADRTTQISHGIKANINKIGFDMSGYAVGNKVSDITVVPVSTLYEANLVYLFRPMDMPSVGEPFDTSKAISNTTEIEAGVSYNMVIVVKPTNTESSFADRVTAKLGRDSGEFVKDAKITIKVEHSGPTHETNVVTVPASVAVFSLKVLNAPITETPEKYDVIVSGSVAETTGAGKYAKDESVTINAGTKAGYTFNGWTASDGVILADATSTTTTFTMPAKSVSVAANWTNNHTHTYGAWEKNANQHWRVCTGTNCPDPTQRAAHAYDDDADTTCNVCDYVRTVSHSHNHIYTWKHDATQHWRVCAVASCPDGGSMKDTAPHVYDNNFDATCDTCGYARTLYTVTFAANGGDGSMANVNVVGEYNLPACGFIAPSGKQFKAWRVGGAEKAVGATINVTSATTVTAIWENSSSVSGGGGGVSTYTITVEDAKNGDVTADRKSASSGTTVTITVNPDKGYTLETLTVLDKNGKEVKLTNKGNGKYTFKMPASKVTVKGTFMEDNSMLNFFVDVPADAYFADAVLWAAENGITGGIDAVHFAPYATCTRAQAVTFLWRAAGCPAPKSTVMPFTDVMAGSYCYDAVLWAVENGITKGTTETTFTPNAECSRAQIVTFLWRSQKSPAVDAANPFTDVSAEAYYASAVLWAAENGITGGTTATTFTPDADCTRAQIVTFIYRCMK